MTAPPKWTYAQSRLFDAQAAEAALNDAVERVERATDAEWLKAAQAALRLVAEHRETFTTDALHAILARWGIDAPREPRALGAIMRWGKSQGICQPTHMTSRCIRVACHRRDLRVWKSLIFSAQANGWAGDDL